MAESSSPPILTVTDNVWQFAFPDNYQLEIHHPHRDRNGHLLAEVVARYGAHHLLNRARIDLLNLRDREQFHIACTAVNGTVDTASRLVIALEEIVKTLDASGAGTPQEAKDVVWHRALSAVDFVQQQEDEHQSLTADLVYPGCITNIAAPRGTGKSIVALMLAVAEVQGGLFRGERLQPVRVLYVDRDNPPRLIRERLRRIGVEGAGNLRVLTRKDAPPLTDRATWLTLPQGAYDVVIIDSLGAATEGVSEKEGKETQHFLATLKDLAQQGLAIVALDNTIKAGTNYRGRGEKADAVDILYEARDITSWTPTQEDWWTQLPEAGDHTWASRASRHRQKTHMRIAFVASKFRLGMDPEPFALEIDFRGDCWTLRDVTEELVQVGAESRDIDRKAKQDLFRQATEALVIALRQRPAEPRMTKTEAEEFLMERHLRRTEARNLLEANNGQAWNFEIDRTRRGHPTVFVPLPSGKNSDGGEKDHGQETRDNSGDAQMRFTPYASPADGVKRPSADTHNSTISARPFYADGQASIRRKTPFSTQSNEAGDQAGAFYAAEEFFSGAGSKGRDRLDGALCPMGGFHTWLKRGDARRLCARCNAEGESA